MWRTTTKLRRITGLDHTRGGRGGSRTFEGIRGPKGGGFLWEGTRPLWTFQPTFWLNLLLSFWRGIDIQEGCHSTSPILNDR